MRPAISREILTHKFIKLVIPKYHGAKLADIPDDHLTEILASL